MVLPPPVGTVSVKRPRAERPLSRQAFNIAVRLPFTVFRSPFSSHGLTLLFNLSNRVSMLS